MTVRCPDAALNQPYTTSWELTDTDGSLVASGVTMSLSLYFLGPGGTAAAVSGPEPATYLGGGDWGVTWPASVLATPGYYEARSGPVTFGSTVLGAQVVGFTVGTIPPEFRTLRGIVAAVCEALGVGLAGTTTGAGSTTTLVDSRWADSGRATDEFVGDELVLLAPAAVSDPNPVRVTAYAPSTGAFTFAPAVTGMASGRDYLLLRPGKRGVRYAQIREAIVAAVADLATRQAVTDSVTLRTVRGTRDYAWPAAFLGVDMVQLARQPTASDPYWETPAPIYYDLWPDQRTIHLKLDVGGEYLLRLTGTVGVPVPDAMTQIVRVPWTRARDAAVAYLSVPIEQRAGLAMRRATTAGTRAGV
jgi:hypothetical protein